MLDDPAIHYTITRHMMKCVLGALFELKLPAERSDDEDDPNIEIDLRRFEELLFETTDAEFQVGEP
jgi:hypothetical protein